LLVLLVSTVGYVVYVVIIEWFKSADGQLYFLKPVGMVIAGIFLTIRHHPFDKYTARNLITGLI
jgi:glucose uptake protein